MFDLPRNKRLCHRDRISELFQSGAKAGGSLVVVRTLANGTDSSRVAVIAGKSVGNATVRNRLRRRLRAAYRLHCGGLPSGWDLALIAKNGLLEAKWEDVCRDVTGTIARAVGAATGPRRPRRRP